MAKRKRPINKDPQKAKYWGSCTPLTTGVNSGAPEGYAVPVPLVTTAETLMCVCSTTKALEKSEVLSYFFKGRLLNLQMANKFS